MVRGDVDARLRAGAWVLLGALIWLSAAKARAGVLGEMLWACHVASLMITAGVLRAATTWVRAGTLFHLGAGLPAYALEVWAHGTTVPSLITHTLSPLWGLIYLRRRTGDTAASRRALLLAVVLYPALLLPSRLLTDARLNVNLAFGAWPPLAERAPAWPWVSVPAVTWLGNTALIGLLVVAMDAALRRWLGQHEVSGIRSRSGGMSPPSC